MVAKTIESPKAKVSTDPSEDLAKDAIPKPVALDENGNVKKNMLGMAKKKPRAEYQAGIDELTEENLRLKKQLSNVKSWLMKAPVENLGY